LFPPNIANTLAILGVMEGGRLYGVATMDEVWPPQKPLERHWFWNDSARGHQTPAVHPPKERRMRAWLLTAVSLSLTVMSPASPQAAPPPVSRKLVEIYRIAPGQHQAFLEAIARYDEANRMAGLPPRELYVHSDGADWDFLLIQPAQTPPDKAAALDAAWEKLGLPSGADFFIEFRRYVAEHTDTFVEGPTTATDFLARRQKR